ncbi:hypothetical protein Deba_3033 [Desulfarculus baarsii DSM 2075]|uniref:Uncharacterized protein n=1 Tax=Desulfarculus baarsii (strain ATCC 33931 / DSM 2075 / LMG 7858 / VKM B-1802 / 2st14) TaxID=644282 RepID=E1QLF1_DESB2|nr:hypothetical protein [Desulfarculus baarsii]ADK86386.1 hypothetical protein Deba_3033 [Desulfarculus baarsii DSM 2075]
MKNAYLKDYLRKLICLVAVELAGLAAWYFLIPLITGRWLVNLLRNKLYPLIDEYGLAQTMIRGLGDGVMIVGGATLVLLVAWAVVLYRSRPADPAEWLREAKRTRWFMIVLAFCQAGLAGALVGLSHIFDRLAVAYVAAFGFVFFVLLAALAVYLGSPTIFRAAVAKRGAH